MKNLFLIVFGLTIVFGVTAQNDSLQNDSLHNDRYEVINAVIKKGEINKKFFNFQGLEMFLKPEITDPLFGNCIDIENKVVLSYAEVFSDYEKEQLVGQMNDFYKNDTIDKSLLNADIKLANDRRNNVPSISLPLIINDKAFLYYLYKDSSGNYEESVRVLINKDGEWVSRCRKMIALVIVD
jgi:hypothetical protein